MIDTTFSHIQKLPVHPLPRTLPTSRQEATPPVSSDANPSALMFGPIRGVLGYGLKQPQPRALPTLQFKGRSKDEIRTFDNSVLDDNLKAAIDYLQMNIRDRPWETEDFILALLRDPDSRPAMEEVLAQWTVAPSDLETYLGSIISGIPSGESTTDVTFMGASLWNAFRVMYIKYDQAASTSANDDADSSDKPVEGGTEVRGKLGIGDFLNALADSENPEFYRDEEEKQYKDSNAALLLAINDLSWANPETTTPYLDAYTTDLTYEAKSQKLPPVIARSNELARMIITLSQGQKSSLMLVGKTGAGKKSMVNRLAQIMADGGMGQNVATESSAFQGLGVTEREALMQLFKGLPPILQRTTSGGTPLFQSELLAGSDTKVPLGKRILKLNWAKIARAGNKLGPGGDSQILAAILAEAERKSNEVILFIDEIHQLFPRNGFNEGNAQAIKESLKDGKLRIIGTTTPDNLRSRIETDEYLGNAFTLQTIEPPNKDDALSMMRGVKPYLEKQHQVRIEDNAIELAVNLSDKLLHSINPASSYQILDAACGLVKSRQSGYSPSYLRSLQLLEKLSVNIQGMENRLENYKLGKKSAEGMLRQRKEEAAQTLLELFSSNKSLEDDEEKRLLHNIYTALRAGQEVDLEKVQTILQTIAKYPDQWKEKIEDPFHQLIGQFIIAQFGKQFEEDAAALMTLFTASTIPEEVIEKTLLQDIKGNLAEKKTISKKQIEQILFSIFSDFDQWQQTIQDPFHQLVGRFAINYLGNGLGDGGETLMELFSSSHQQDEQLLLTEIIAALQGGKKIDKHKLETILEALIVHPDDWKDTIKDPFEQTIGEFATGFLSHEVQRLRGEQVNINSITTLEQVGQTELNRLTKRLHTMQQELTNPSEGTHPTTDTVTPDDIRLIVSLKANIPLQKLTESMAQKLQNLEQEIGKRLIGQEQAVKIVSDTIRRKKAGLADPDKPIGSFFFLGPTGVGKTELAKALADVMFDDPDLLLRLDMSEFKAAHSVARLLGSPAGYVGYGDESLLVAAMKNNPHRVILFDEIEKAHPDVYDLFLQILDRGTLTTSDDQVISFKDTIVIVTSNVGSNRMLDQFSKFGIELPPEHRTFKKAYQNLQMDAKTILDDSGAFRPEILNRFDAFVAFHPLMKAHLSKIVDLQIAALNRRLAQTESRIQVNIDDSAREYIVNEGSNLEYGARPINRFINETIANILTQGLLSKDYKPNEEIHITADTIEEWLTKHQES